MSFVFVAIASVFVAWYVLRKRKRSHVEDSSETSDALDGWVADALEIELAERVLGMRASTIDERKPLAKSLRGNPDPDVVAKIEAAVRKVDIEYVHYAHESDVLATVHVRYEDGADGNASRRMAWSDVPASVSEELKRGTSTHTFRSLAFPWARVRAL